MSVNSLTSFMLIVQYVRAHFYIWVICLFLPPDHTLALHYSLLNMQILQVYMSEFLPSCVKYANLHLEPVELCCGNSH